MQQMFYLLITLEN